MGLRIYPMVRNYHYRPVTRPFGVTFENSLFGRYIYVIVLSLIMHIVKRAFGPGERQYAGEEQKTFLSFLLSSHLLKLSKRFLFCF